MGCVGIFSARMKLFPVQKTVDRIVVTIFDRLIHRCAISLDAWAHHNMIKPEIHATSVVTDAWTIAASGIGVVQNRSESVVNIRNRSGIEISTQNDALVGVAIDVSHNRIYL